MHFLSIKLKALELICAYQIADLLVLYLHWKSVFLLLGLDGWFDFWTKMHEAVVAK